VTTFAVLASLLSRRPVRTLGAIAVALSVLAAPAAAGRLPILAPHDWWPVYSPDSHYVAFTEVNGQGRVFTLKVVDTATKRVRTLAQADSQLLPSWSPDSRSLAYQSGGGIWTVGVEGANRRAVHDGSYPAWSPDGTKLAYIWHSSVYVDGVRWSGDAVIGMPAWSPDGKAIVFTRSDGIYLRSSQGEQKVASPPGEVRSVVWSPDGTQLAYATQGSVYVVVPVTASKPQRVAGPFMDVGPLAWSPPGDRLAYTVRGGVELSTREPTWHSELLVKGAAVGTSYAPSGTRGDVLAYAGPNLHCPGHDAIRIYELQQLAGSCAIAGTAGADTIEGTSGGGDRLAAGAGNDTIRAKDGRPDSVSCGPGRDTVWADRTDRLSACEVIHH
jgi:hypothetical protein